LETFFRILIIPTLILVTFCVLCYISTYILNNSMVNDYLININVNYKKIVHMYYKYRQYTSPSIVEYEESL